MVAYIFFYSSWNGLNSALKTRVSNATHSINLFLICFLCSERRRWQERRRRQRKKRYLIKKRKFSLKFMQMKRPTHWLWVCQKIQTQKSMFYLCRNNGTYYNLMTLNLGILTFCTLWQGHPKNVYYLFH